MLPPAKQPEGLSQLGGDWPYEACQPPDPARLPAARRRAATDCPPACRRPVTPAASLGMTQRDEESVHPAAQTHPAEYACRVGVSVAPIWNSWTRSDSQAVRSTSGTTPNQRDV